ncbi:hypothetical protein AMK59_2308 [Oryctes borbonicus]|uniref:THAP-type domain-containing protein n=1 Tax=Oryctes borbonicus TaxID=1629725 RepID=A0A0T6BAH8_9SCAR|nr:hypothetical protein AMK59_2308 [Oryctes borbonicus]
MTNKIPFLCGINEEIFHHLQNVVQNIKKLDKYCVLMFDEISLEAGLQYSKKYDYVEGFVDMGGNKRRPLYADHALVFLLKGIKSKWKQPVCFVFSQGTTATAELVVLIREVIRNCRRAGLNIVATICDQGATNQAAINYLVNETRVHCLKRNIANRLQGYLIDNEEVVHMYDFPHLLKGVRNNMLNKNLHFGQNGIQKVARWSHIIQAYNIEQKQGPYSLCYKLTEEHVLPNRIRKMKVKNCSQVFSHTVSSAIYTRATISTELDSQSSFYLDPKATETADLLQFFDKLFDSVNGSLLYPEKGKELRCVVKPNSRHIQFWQTSLQTLRSMYFKTANRRQTSPSLKNWIFSLESLSYISRKLFDLKFDFFSPRVFNQDPLENFFSQIRSHSVRNPTCSTFANSFKTLVINNFVSTGSVGANCENDESSGALTNLQDFLTQKIHFTTPEVCENIVPSITAPEEFLKDFATPYVAGVVIKKIFKRIDCLSCKELLITSDILPEHEYIRRKEALHCSLFKPSRVFSNFVLRASKEVLFLIPKLICSYGLINKICSFVEQKVCSNILCERHVSDTSFIVKTITKILIFNYLKKINNILKGRDKRSINMDYFAKIAYEKSLKRIKRKCD